MKLLFCPDCHDVHELIPDTWRMCLCGKSGGQYNRDGMTATIGGNARVFGVGNTFFNELYPLLGPDGKKIVRQRYFGQETDAWWGEYPGDQQIFRIKSAEGPCLKVKVEVLDGDVGLMDVTIVDKTPHLVDGKSDVKRVRVPRGSYQPPPDKKKKKKRKKKNGVWRSAPYSQDVIDVVDAK